MCSHNNTPWCIPHLQPCGTYTTPALSHPAIAMQSTVTCIQHSEPYAISAHTDIPPSEPCSTCPVSVLPTKRSQSPHHEGQLRLPILHCYAVTLPQHATSVSFRTAAPRKTSPRQAQGSLDNPKPTTSADKCSRFSMWGERDCQLDHPTITSQLSCTLSPAGPTAQLAHPCPLDMGVPIPSHTITCPAFRSHMLYVLITPFFKCSQPAPAQHLWFSLSDRTCPHSSCLFLLFHCPLSFPTRGVHIPPRLLAATLLSLPPPPPSCDQNEPCNT